MKLEQRQQKQKSQYHKGAKPLPELKPSKIVRYQAGKSWKPATVINKHESPRSYNIPTSKGAVLRKNRHHLKQTKETVCPLDDFIDDNYDTTVNSDILSSDEPPHTAPPQYCERCFRYGHVIRPPIRYRND